MKLINRKDEYNSYKREFLTEDELYDGYISEYLTEDRLNMRLSMRLGMRLINRTDNKNLIEDELYNDYINICGVSVLENRVKELKDNNNLINEKVL